MSSSVIDRVGKISNEMRNTIFLEGRRKWRTFDLLLLEFTIVFYSACLESAKFHRSKEEKSNEVCSCLSSFSPEARINLKNWSFKLRTFNKE